MDQQRTIEDIDRGRLHPAVDGQSLGKRWSNRQRTTEDTDGGLHPAVDGQSLDERGKSEISQGVMVFIMACLSNCCSS